MDDKLNSTYSELVNAAHTVMKSYNVSDEEIHNLQEATQLQPKCRLWSTHRAGRITASNFKSAVQTDPDKPSISLVKKLCYPQQHAFSTNATRWGCDQGCSKRSGWSGVGRTTISQGKNKVPFYKKQVINKSTRMIFELV